MYKFFCGVFVRILRPGEYASVSGTIKKNTLYNLSSKVVQVVMALWLIPFTIFMIGTEKYGVWAVIQVTTTLLGCIDLGISGAYIKFFSENREDSVEVGKILSTGIAYNVVLTLCVVPVLFFCPVTELFMDFFDISPVYSGEAAFALRSNALFFLLSNIFLVFHHYLVAAGRQDITNKILILSSLLNALVTFLVLKSGLGLYGLALSFALIQVVNGVLFFAAVSGTSPRVDISLLRVSKDTFTKMFNFGKNIQVCHIADLITLYTDRLLAGLFFGVELAGLQHVGATLVNRLRETPNLFLSAMLPEACRLASEGDRNKLMELYRESTRRLVTVVAPLFFFTAASSPLLVFVWMGAGYNSVAYVTAVLSVGSLFGVLGGTGCVIGQAVSRADIQMKTGLLTAFSNILLSVLLAVKVGFIGVSAATALASLLGFIYFFTRLDRELEFSHFLVMKKALPPLLCSCTLAFALFPANLLITGPEFVTGRFSGGVLLLMEFFIFMTLYLSVLFAVRHYTAHGWPRLLSPGRFLKKGVF